jgi:hypothetical protein
MKYDWLAFLFTLGILFGMFHGYMQDLSTMMNATGAAIAGATMVEFVARIVQDIHENKKVNKLLGLE